MPKVVVEVNGEVVQTYDRATNRSAFAHAWHLSKVYSASLKRVGHWEIYVVTRDARFGKMGTVIQMDMDGREVEFYETMVEAQRSTGIHKSNIMKAIRGKLKQAGGFKWKRVG